MGGAKATMRAKTPNEGPAGATPPAPATADNSVLLDAMADAEGLGEIDALSFLTAAAEAEAAPSRRRGKKGNDAAKFAALGAANAGAGALADDRAAFADDVLDDDATLQASQAEDRARYGDDETAAINLAEMGGINQQYALQTERQRLLGLYDRADRSQSDARVQYQYRDSAAKQGVGARQDELAAASLGAYEAAGAAKGDIARTLIDVTGDGQEVLPYLTPEDLQGKIGQHRTALQLAEEDATLETARARPDEDVAGNTAITVGTGLAAASMGALGSVPILGKLYKSTDLYKQNRKELASNHDAVTGEAGLGELMETVGNAAGGAGMQAFLLGGNPAADAVVQGGNAIEGVTNAASVWGTGKDLEGNEVTSGWGQVMAGVGAVAGVAGAGAAASRTKGVEELLGTDASRAAMASWGSVNNTVQATQGAAKGVQGAVTAVAGEDVLGEDTRHLSGEERWLAGVGAAADLTGAAATGIKDAHFGAEQAPVQKHLDSAANWTKAGVGATKAASATVGAVTGTDPITDKAGAAKDHVQAAVGGLGEAVAPKLQSRGDDARDKEIAKRSAPPPG